MIKYSQRGLVVNGKVPFLFYLLYLLINVVFYSQWSFFILFRLLSDSKSFDENMLKTFKGEGQLLVKKFTYFATLMCIFLMLLLIMTFGVFYLKRKSKKNHHFRQNVFTYNSTFFWGLLHCSLFVSLIITLFMEEIHILSVIRILAIFSLTIKSVVTIFENQRNFPELFMDIETKNESSYCNLTNVRPRQETFMPFISFTQNAR